MARKKDKEIVCPLTGIKCDSPQEMYFIWWMVDLKKAGYIDDFKRSKSYILSDREYYKEGITKKIKDKVLLESHIYTPDFVILWNYNLSINLFICNSDNVNIKNIPFLIFNKVKPVSIIDIKGVTNPRFDKGGSLKSFTINQKWLYQHYEVYTQMVEITSLFRTTFTPSRYLITDKGTRSRAMKWKGIHFN